MYPFYNSLLMLIGNLLVIVFMNYHESAFLSKGGANFHLWNSIINFKDFVIRNVSIKESTHRKQLLSFFIDHIYIGLNETRINLINIDSSHLITFFDFRIFFLLKITPFYQKFSLILHIFNQFQVLQYSFSMV